MTLKLKPYAVIDCAEQSIIADKTLEFLRQSTDLLEQKNLHLWNKINTVALLKAVPEINLFYNSLELKIREIAITVWNNHNDVSLHIDELPVIAKINFPILNTKNTYNEWYTVPDHLLESVQPNVNQFGTKSYDLSEINLSQCVKIGEVELINPVIFNSQLPHKIRMGINVEFPRIVMSCMFFNQPIKWLESINTPNQGD
jgi:hypothetical protein